MKSRAEQIRVGLLRGELPGRSFGELESYWLEHRASQKRSRRHDVSIINKHLRVAFGHLRVDEIALQHVDRFLAERCHLSPKTLGNHLTLLISMLNLAKDMGWIESVPRIRKPRIIIHADDFSFLSKAEVGRFLETARLEGELVHTLYSTAVYTGMRLGELAGLQWDDVDFEIRIITVQRSFNGRTKSGRIRRVPIVDSLLTSLQRWRLRSPLPVVFPNAHGVMHKPASRIFQETLHRVLARTGFERITRNGRSRPYITFHDLRHTFASLWMREGGDLFKLQRILGHQTVQMTMRYAHLSPDAFREDWSRFGGDKTPAEVIPLRARVDPGAPNQEKTDDRKTAQLPGNR